MTKDQPTGNEVLKGGDLEAFFNDTYEPEIKEDVIPSAAEFFNEDDTNSGGDIIPTPSASKTEDIPTTKEKPDFYMSLVKDMIEDGDWTDGEIELENGEKVLLSEMKDVTPELFKEIKNAQKEIKKQDFDSKYISKEGLDDTALKMIELKKAGGDLSNLIRDEAQFIHPLKGLDLDNEEVQANLVFQKYSSQGIDRDIIEMKIQKLVKDSQLDLEAQKIIKEVDTNFSARVEDEKNRVLENNKKIQEQQKVFRKDISEAVKGLDIKNKEALVKSLIDKTSKYDENGLTDVDKLYFESKESPELHAKIAFLLSNEKEFTEFFNSKAKLESKKEATRTILQITPRGSSEGIKKGGDAIQEFFNS